MFFGLSPWPALSSASFREATAEHELAESGALAVGSLSASAAREMLWDAWGKLVCETTCSSSFSDAF